MHHALHIHEILLNIFGHCFMSKSSFPPCNHSTELVALARTCRAFKEPALDILWSELFNFSPLVRCIPQACQFTRGKYSFSRPLSEAEWGTIRDYTRRVRIIHDCTSHCSSSSLAVDIIFNSPFAAPLFPNLRCLQWRGLDSIPVVHVAASLLTSITFNFAYRSACVHRSFFSDVAAMNLAPNVKRFEISLFQGHPFDDTICKAICRWQHLCVVDCFMVTLNADAILHLSRVPSLTRLRFTVTEEAMDSILLSDASPLVFSHLTYLNIRTNLLERLTRLFSGIRLPALQILIVRVFGYLRGQTVGPFMSTMRPTCSVESLTQFQLICDRFTTPLQKKSEHLDRLCIVDDVRPLMVFNRLRSLWITLQWSEVPRDDELLEWVAAWPDMKELVINACTRLVGHLTAIGCWDPPK
ncbi:hypothetical protein JVU11DRAFT_2201 [Chiua virens]|nr:hypothetical protein JVU11DRAFT_2201 [Chiua virens]